LTSRRSNQIRSTVRRCLRIALLLIVLCSCSRTLADDGDWLVGVLKPQSAGLPPEFVKHLKVYDLAYSPDGTTLAAASGQSEWGCVLLWDASQHRLTSMLGGYSKRVLSVAFSHDGKKLATGSMDGKIWIWDVAARRVEHVLVGAKGRTKVAFSPDSRLLVSNCNAVPAFDSDQLLAGGIRLWDTNTGHEELRLGVDKHEVTAVAFSPDGKSVASGTSLGALRIWDVATGKLQTTLLERGGMIWTLTYSQDGKMLASGGAAGAEIWDPSSGGSLRKLKGFSSSHYKSVAFSPTENYLSVAEDRGVLVFDLASKHKGLVFPHDARVMAVAFSPDGKTVASGSEAGIVRLWRVEIRKGR